jgi:hypothetical protein
MKATIFLLVCAALLPPCGRPAAAEPPRTGKVLLLENEHTLLGDVERVGEQYRVRRVVGETWVPAGRVLCLCGSLEEAYAFVRGRANLKDPDERLRLARWCRANGLRDQAVAEVRAAVQLRPEHAETRRLLAHLEQAAALPAAAPRPAVAEGPPPAVDLTGECLGAFATRVQPILMNTCASCHTPAHPGPFKLERAYDMGLLNTRTMQQNLAAVLAQVNTNQPQSSPLLTKAVSDHGKVGQAPLRGRQAPAYRMLEDWVRLTVDNNPQLREPAGVPAGAEPHPPAPRGEAAWGTDAPHAPPAGPPAPTPVPAAPAAAPAAQPPAGAPARPPDPFDPEEFNRQAHPDKPKPPAGGVR